MSVVVGETRERFIGAIAERVLPERIVEIHFFHPIKQGGVESGVAVVAAEREGDVDAQADGDGSRYTVFTAHYRLTLKGPDRGKWITSIVEEADAPLLTVESVVRGVQRRSGDVEDPEKMEGADARSVIEELRRRTA